MSSHKNARRGEEKYQDNGPTWEGGPPCSGCNSTHVARSRAKWKKIKNRTFRRNGKVTHKFRPMKAGVMKPVPKEDEES